VNDAPTHLLLPLLASLLFVCGLLFVKRATSRGVSPWTVTFIANQWAALIFSMLWTLGGEMQPLSSLWQPAVIAVLYILGQAFTFSAIERGDVSVATPVFGIKVVLVAFLVTLLFGETLTVNVWIGAALATVGIALVQWSPAHSDLPGRSQIALTIVLAILAATAFALFDVLVQKWGPAWKPGRLLPIVYWMVSVLSLGFLPWVQWPLATSKSIRGILIPGTMLIALQALCIVFTLAAFGDAARVNVVYAMRGMWGVLLAWLVAVIWGGNEAKLPRSIMIMRAIGAVLLTASVILIVLAG